MKKLIFVCWLALLALLPPSSNAQVWNSVNKLNFTTSGQICPVSAAGKQAATSSGGLLICNGSSYISVTTGGGSASNGSGYSPGTATFLTPGSYSWIAPTGVNLVQLTMVAGGGPGGNGNPGYTCGAGKSGAGGSGYYLYNQPYPVTPGQSYSIVVGAAGPVGSVQGNSTSFGSVVVNGGYAGGMSNYGQGGDGGNGGAGGGPGSVASGFGYRGGNGGCSSANNGRTNVCNSYTTSMIWLYDYPNAARGVPGAGATSPASCVMGYYNSNIAYPTACKPGLPFVDGSFAGGDTDQGGRGLFYNGVEYGNGGVGGCFTSQGTKGGDGAVILRW